ncbi:hypothetical protein D3C80_1410420 [compost metagenome]
MLFWLSSMFFLIFALCRLIFPLRLPTFPIKSSSCRLIGSTVLRVSSESSLSIKLSSIFKGVSWSPISSKSRREKKDIVRNPSSLLINASMSALRPVRKLCSSACNSTFAFVTFSKFSRHFSLKYFPSLSMIPRRRLMCPTALESYSLSTAKAVSFCSTLVSAIEQ